MRQRLPRLLALLARHRPDVVCLQETKTTDVDFPDRELAGAGYGSMSYGQRAYNGVAIVARTPITEVSRGFDGDPVPAEARVISASVGGIRVVNVYVVNGKAVGDPAYEVKLRWLDALTTWLAGSADKAAPLVVAGDFNVAPSDLDVHDPGTVGRQEPRVRARA